MRRLPPFAGAARLVVLPIALAVWGACDSGTPPPDPPPGPGPVFSPVAAACDAPPFGGTVFLTPDLITPADPTAFTGAASAGRGSRRMFDRRVDNWITVDAYLVRLSFADGPAVEVQVNPEVGSAGAALALAQRFGPAIGQLPRALRADVETVWIHEGTFPFGGGNDNLLIHVGQADDYDATGVLEEVLVHEAAHTSLDAAHAGAAYWTEAQGADRCFVSTYARDFPTREDVAESLVPYLALRHRPEALTPEQRAAIAASMPNRMVYFDWLDLDLSPFEE